MAEYIACPQCGEQNMKQRSFCWKCLAGFSQQRPSPSPGDNSPNLDSDPLDTATALLVTQKKEWGEILTGFETKNKYSILDSAGQELMLAAEESSFLARFFLKNKRPHTVHILTRNGALVLKLQSPFRFYFSEMSVLDKFGIKLGTITREFSLLRRQFSVRDQHGREMFKIISPLLRIWTFQIHSNHTEVGRISKTWSGLGKELFTDADTFNITFPSGITSDQKKVLLGALFLIDMKHFEKSN